VYGRYTKNVAIAKETRIYTASFAAFGWTFAPGDKVM
jgi:hypothetical protein